MTATIVTSQPTSMHVMLAADSREARLARQLRRKSTVKQQFNPALNPANQLNSVAQEARLRSQWILDAIQELTSGSEAVTARPALERISDHLVATFDIGQRSSRACVRKYTEWMQLQSLLPLYLSQPKDRLQESVGWSHRLVEEAVLLLELDEALGEELVDHLCDGGLSDHHPASALHRTLTIHLDTLATNAVTYRRNAGERVGSNLVHIPFDETRRQSYWTLAQQLMNGASHFHIPAHLNVGKVTWPRVSDHWKRIRNFLEKFTIVAVLDDEPASALTGENSASRNRPVPVEATTPEENNEAWSVIEIRSANDPKLSETLCVELDRCRDDGRAMSLAVFQCPTQESHASPKLLKPWHTLLLDVVRTACGDRVLRGFIAESGELAIILAETDRTEATHAMRSVIEQVEAAHQPASRIVETPKLGIACGLACVEVPSKRLKIEQLIEAAWRCLGAAAKQGTGTVKSIEIY